MAYLVVFANDKEIARHKLRDRVVLGRHAECGLRVPERDVSRYHCQFELMKGQWTVTDLQSTNGTYLHGKRVEMQPLREGDVLEMGNVRVEFHEEEERPTRPKDPTEALLRETLGKEPEVPDLQSMGLSSTLPFPRPKPMKDVQTASYEVGRSRAVDD